MAVLTATVTGSTGGFWWLHACGRLPFTVSHLGSGRTPPLERPSAPVDGMPAWRGGIAACGTEEGVSEKRHHTPSRRWNCFWNPVAVPMPETRSQERERGQRGELEGPGAWGPRARSRQQRELGTLSTGGGQGRRAGRAGLRELRKGGGVGGGVSGVSIHVAGVCWVHTCAQAPSWVQGHNGDHTQAGALPSC